MVQQSTLNNQPGDSPINLNSPSSPSHQSPHSSINASSSSHQHHITSPSSSSNITLRIEPKKDPTALLTWICAAEVRYPRNYCYPRKELYLRAIRHLAFMQWGVEFQPPDDKDRKGKYMFTPPDDENQRFDNLLDACNYEFSEDQDAEDELRQDQDVEELVSMKTLDEEGMLRCGLCNIAGIDYVIIGLNHTFCSNACKGCFDDLQNLLCENVTIDDASTSWSLIRYDTIKSKINQQCDHELFKEAAETLCSGFGAGIESMVKDMVYNEKGEHGGFYTCIIQKEGKCASVAVFRAHARKGFVEIPIVATGESFRSQGLCKKLMHSIENCVKQLGIKHLILPSLRTRLAMWKHFGFKPIQDDDLNFLLQGNNLDIIENFEGTTLCLKTLSSEYDYDV